MTRDPLTPPTTITHYFTINLHWDWDDAPSTGEGGRLVRAMATIMEGGDGEVSMGVRAWQRVAKEDGTALMKDREILGTPTTRLEELANHIKETVREHVASSDRFGFILNKIERTR